jgi:hypothetical protein
VLIQFVKDKKLDHHHQFVSILIFRSLVQNFFKVGSRRWRTALVFARLGGGEARRVQAEVRNTDVSAGSKKKSWVRSLGSG